MEIVLELKSILDQLNCIRGYYNVISSHVNMQLINELQEALNIADKKIYVLYESETYEPGTVVEFTYARKILDVGEEKSINKKYPHINEIKPISNSKIPNKILMKYVNPRFNIDNNESIKHHYLYLNNNVIWIDMMTLKQLTIFKMLRFYH